MIHKDFFYFNLTQRESQKENTNEQAPHFKSLKH